jgi:hypothetical protein
MPDLRRLEPVKAQVPARWSQSEKKRFQKHIYTDDHQKESISQKQHLA